jgi:hypothetical protein
MERLSASDQKRYEKIVLWMDRTKIRVLNMVAKPVSYEAHALIIAQLLEEIDTYLGSGEDYALKHVDLSASLLAALDAYVREHNYVYKGFMNMLAKWFAVLEKLKVEVQRQRHAA